MDGYYPLIYSFNELFTYLQSYIWLMFKRNKKLLLCLNVYIYIYIYIYSQKSMDSKFHWVTFIIKVSSSPFTNFIFVNVFNVTIW